MNGNGRIIVCLCGSTRFKDAFLEASKRETLAGKIVVSVGWFAHADSDKPTAEQKRELDELHLDKIDLAHEVLILNVGGYIGESTQRELAYAVYLHKGLRFLDKIEGERYMIRERHALGKHVANFVTREGRHG